MLEKLLNKYKHAFIKGYHPERDGVLWLSTDEGESFGLLKSALSPSETKLLQALFASKGQEQFLSQTEKAWHQFLFQNGPYPGSEKGSGVRFYYLYIKDLVDREAFAEALHGTFEEAAAIWSGAHRVILADSKAGGAADIDAIRQFSDTLTSDFYAEPSFLIGQLHKPGEGLSGKFEREFAFSAAIHEIGRKKLMTFYEALPKVLLARPGLVDAGLLSDYFLESIEDQEIVDTLNVYMACNLNASSAAKKLYMHRNSFQYRIDRFIEKTGIDIKQFTEASAVYMILAGIDLLAP
ncbi:helix-turn-helix domain-containing protein [Metabacillus sp. GX 13764]|uniref:helix-turn-helix domain-containing protein n=1 Tax=Metabacillus kandeliae TaxID=2900151 RepID=UPI001E53E2EB|nr:helix-turn-helix domain-containing protein [Metabacillus kandeliae]MCD7034829.1 helix-turn-helix domain-containing protein [Metabacillus kandeliae]